MISAEWRPGETWVEWRARCVRRERWRTRIGIVVGIGLACVLSWVVVGAAVGAIP